MLKSVALREREVYRNTPRFLARAFGWNDGTAIKLRGSVCRWAQNGENGAPSEMLFRQHPSGDIRRQWGVTVWVLGETIACGHKVLTQPSSVIACWWNHTETWKQKSTWTHWEYCTGSILRELTVWGGKARTKTAHMGPKNLLEHWNDSFPRSVLSQTKHCRVPENVPGTNWCRLSFSLSLASLPFVFRCGSSSKVGRKEKCSEPIDLQKSYKVSTCSIRTEGPHTNKCDNAKM